MPKYDPHPIVRQIDTLNAWLSTDVPPGPAFIPMCYVINLQKGGSLFFCLFLMDRYENYSAPALMYTVAHGSYGMLWCLKHICFPDPKYFAKQTFFSVIVAVSLVLGPYWVAPFLLISRSCPEPSTQRCAVALFVYIIGVSIMMIADVWKYVQLKAKKGLITEGPFSLVRHPNYAGEMMVYGAFAAMVPHWVPWMILAYVWTQLFLTNMLVKEASMSRYRGWGAYYRRTGMILPWIPALLKRDTKEAAALPRKEA